MRTIDSLYYLFESFLQQFYITYRYLNTEKGYNIHLMNNYYNQQRITISENYSRNI